LRHGMLPQVHTEPDDAVDVLEAYVANYVREEVIQEALVRNIESFARFLEVAALMNGQVLNVSGVARDAAVARPTVQGYFATLVDTLIGVWLPAWRRRAKVKEVASPKFFLFDPGVARALAGRSREPVESAERGFLLETLVLHELRAAQAYPEHRRPAPLLAHALGHGGGLRLDARGQVRWHRSEGFPVVEARARRRPETPAGRRSPECRARVYTGTAELKDGPLRVWPVATFLRQLAAGSILDA
jgi:hypothetical protein